MFNSVRRSSLTVRAVYCLSVHLLLMLVRVSLLFPVAVQHLQLTLECMVDAMSVDVTAC